MIDDLPNEVKRTILAQEFAGIKQQIYRLSVSAEVRKIAGYSAEENKGLLDELERLVKMRDALAAKIADLG